MSGICGFTGNVKNKKKTLTRMCDALTHRGPKGKAFYEGEEISVGRCAFEKEDTELAYSEDKSLILAFDGRIYNSKELRDELASEGYSFTTKSDAEVVLCGFQHFGEEILTKLRGMFAFAIYNEDEKTLFMARDPFGIKPLYYTIVNKDIAFASEIRSVLRYPQLERKLKVSSLDSYLSFGYAVAPDTFFEGVYSLLPGHILWRKNGEVATERYFEPRFSPQENMSEEDAVSKVTAAVKNSVAVHKGGGSDVGCFLSGGVDSGYLSTGFAGEKTFSVTFDDEGTAAKIISQESGADHYNESVGREEFWEAVPLVQKLMGQPLADVSAMSVYFTSALAAKYVTSAVCGEGADELFGGYEAYRNPDRYSTYHKIPKALRKGLAGIYSKLPDSAARNFILGGVNTIDDDYLGKGVVCTNEEKWAVMKNSDDATRAQATTKRYFYRVRKADALTQMQYLDINMWLAGSSLYTADRLSMANSLELRFPYLDKEVYRIASSLPCSQRAVKDNTKVALRKAAAKELTTTNLPSSECYVPVDKWLRDKDRFEIIKEEFRSPTAQKYFNIDVLLNWLDEHFEEKADHSRKIWAVYAFLVWHRQFFEAITNEEITEDALAEVEAFAEEDTAVSSMGTVSSERLDELFGLAFDSEQTEPAEQ